MILPKEQNPGLKPFPNEPYRPEKEVLEDCTAYLDRLGLHYFHMPDKKSACQAAPGLPDLLIWETHANPTKLLFVEVKTVIRAKQANGGLHQHQRNWWHRNGMMPLVAYGFKHFKQIIDENFLKDG